MLKRRWVIEAWRRTTEKIRHHSPSSIKTLIWAKRWARSSTMPRASRRKKITATAMKVMVAGAPEDAVCRLRDPVGITFCVRSCLMQLGQRWPTEASVEHEEQMGRPQ